MMSTVIFTTGAILAFVSFFLLLVGSLMVRHNRRSAPTLESAPAPLGFPKVSVLMPARNEAHNLRQTLPLLLDNSYPDWELIILDDQSTDETSAVIEEWIPKSGGVLRRMEGQPLPEGWNGKNWACAQLSREARGEVLIFCDADVHAGSQVVRQTVGMMQHQGASALTVIPHQQLLSWSEEAIVPLIMHFSTLGSVPLRHAASSLRPSLTVANGQWLAMTRRCYDVIGGHEGAKDAIVEDMVLCKRIKQEGRRVCTALAFSQLSVRMYNSFQGIREGFGKNLYGLMQYRKTNFGLVGFLFFVVAMLPWLLPLSGGIGWWLPLVGLLWMRTELALLAGHSVRSILLHPVGSILLFVIAFESMWRYSTDRLLWKDRQLVRPGTAFEEKQPTLIQA